MRITRLFLAEPLAESTEVVLPAEASHYVLRVLRMHEGEPIIVFNGEGGEFHGVLHPQKNAAVVVITQFVPRDIESPVAIHLGQGISRGEKMDYVVQKAVELGVAELTPLFTERCGVKMDEEKIEKRIQHWQKIAQSACEQSQRNCVPRIHAPQPLQAWLVARTEQLKLLCHFEQKDNEKLTESYASCALLVGPEGGFTDEEISSAFTNQFQPFTLGPRVLRTETAAVAALTKVQTLWGDI
ncbi:MAG: 16S rRNA (uracil(1498)-N(3))-methyltransferase [Pseudomonadota bacterium]|nr:16S rRNA (uracil(1498)-N(3))-methyltransferase [Pseudomonadota bacterium]